MNDVRRVNRRHHHMPDDGTWVTSMETDGSSLPREKNGKMGRTHFNGDLPQTDQEACVGEAPGPVKLEG